MKVGDLVRRKTQWGLVRPDRLGVITEMDDMGFFIMNYYVQWQDSDGQSDQLWYREDELEVVNEGGRSGSV